MENETQQNVLTHFDARGQAHMVDVGDKPITNRLAVAQGRIRMSETAFKLLKTGQGAKGDVLAVARIAAIAASKMTGQLIPLCHPLGLTHVAVDFEIDDTTQSICIKVTTQTQNQTGVEMEAMTGVNIGLLTIYDMLKAVDKNMQMYDIYLLKKTGGKSGNFERR